MGMIFVTGRLKLKSHFKISYCGFINTFLPFYNDKPRLARFLGLLCL